MSCHEDLYFLHDTGKLFCLNEKTAMNCVGCHGGNQQQFRRKPHMPTVPRIR